MNDLLSGLTRLILRLIVIAGGIVVFLSVLAAAMLLALVWGVRALWARITGRPVMPWAMRMDPRAGWSTVYRSTARWSATAGTQPEEERAAAGGRRSSLMRGAGLRPSPDVSDVQPREVR